MSKVNLPVLEGWWVDRETRVPVCPAFGQLEFDSQEELDAYVAAQQPASRSHPSREWWLEYLKGGGVLRRGGRKVTLELDVDELIFENISTMDEPGPKKIEIATKLLGVFELPDGYALEVVESNDEVRLSFIPEQKQELCGEMHHHKADPETGICPHCEEPAE